MPAAQPRLASPRTAIGPMNPTGTRLGLHGSGEHGKNTWRNVYSVHEEVMTGSTVLVSALLP